jgi:hypothetical protein
MERFDRKHKLMTPNPIELEKEEGEGKEEGKSIGHENLIEGGRTRNMLHPKAKVASP